MKKIKVTKTYEIEINGDVCQNFCKHFKDKTFYCSLFEKHLQLASYPDVTLRCNDCLEATNDI